MATETPRLQFEGCPETDLDERDVSALETLHEQYLSQGMPERWRMVIYGVYHDYDYLDVQEHIVKRIEHVCWDEGDEPAYDVHVDVADRYDLRELDLEDLQTMTIQDVPKLSDPNPRRSG